MIKLNQIRAARALLGWHQKDLARLAKISQLSVVNIENGKTSPQQSTLVRIVSAFELAGVVFTTNGVEVKDNSYTVLTGENWYAPLLEDVVQTLDSLPEGENKDWFLFYAEEKHYSPSTLGKLRAVVDSGFQQKCFVKEGNGFILGDLNDYRIIPKSFFNDDRLISCYGDKVSICEQGDTESRVYIFRNPELASFIKGLAVMMWDILPVPTRRTTKQILFRKK